MRDPYAVLGVAKSASAAEIKSAFRKLAKKFHPDSNRDDKNAKDKFADVNRAYEIVGDKEKRARYDRGEIDAEGNEKFAGFEGAGSPFEGFEFRTASNRGGGFSADDLGDADDLLKEFLGSAFGNAAGRRGFQSRPGAQGGFSTAGAAPADLDTHMAAKVTVEDLARGKGRLVMPDGKTVSFSIPPGASSGQTIRLAGKGKSIPGMKQGDALVTLSFAPSSRYSVDGADLRMNTPLPLAIAVNGGKLAVQTFDGKLSLTVPAWTDSGKTFRLKGKGLPKKGGGGHGDLLVTVNIALPKDGREALSELMRKPDLRRA